VRRSSKVVNAEALLASLPNSRATGAGLRSRRILACQIKVLGEAIGGWPIIVGGVLLGRISKEHAGDSVAFWGLGTGLMCADTIREPCGVYCRPQRWLCLRK
jgi:hypothetical protein